MKFIHSAGVIVYKLDPVTKERLYLLLLYQKGYWDFAKGKLEPGETVLEAAKRELKEETNLDSDPIPGFEETLSYFFREREGLINKYVTFFVGEAIGNEIILSWEHLDYLWLPYDAAVEQLSFENAREILRKAEKFLRNLEKKS